MGDLIHMDVWVATRALRASSTPPPPPPLPLPGPTAREMQERARAKQLEDTVRLAKLMREGRNLGGETNHRW